MSTASTCWYIHNILNNIFQLISGILMSITTKQEMICRLSFHATFTNRSVRNLRQKPRDIQGVLKISKYLQRLRYFKNFYATEKVQFLCMSLPYFIQSVKAPVLFSVFQYFINSQVFLLSFLLIKSCLILQLAQAHRTGQRFL